MAKKSKKTVRREYTKADVKELRAHSKARTPVAKISKLTKRSVRSLRQKGVEARDWAPPPIILQTEAWLKAGTCASLSTPRRFGLNDP